MEDINYTVELFKRKFPVSRKRIALYGKGPMTRAIIRLADGYNFVGVVDRDVKSGTVYGLPVIAIDEIQDHDIDIIVVVARPESAYAVYKRIGMFCVEKHIGLYGVDGSNLVEAYGTDDLECNAGLIFRENFANDKKRRIALYGKGPIAKSIIDQNADFNIRGIMDRTLKQGVALGKQILDYEEVLDRDIDIIVTATKDAHKGAIAKRIGEFCSYNHILLYDYKGDNLLQKKAVKEVAEGPSPYFNVDEEQLRKQIKEHDIITFDIFDTLVMRKTLNATDVFDIMQHKLKRNGIIYDNFKQLRILAQESGVPNPNLDEIYERLQVITGMSDSLREQIKELEIDTEKKVLVRREKIVELMEYANKLGKEVHIISDMYLPETVLRDILVSLDITGYEKMYVSCDYRTLKTEGLFAHFCKDNVDNKSVLHIGDSGQADGDFARKNGLDAFVIMSAKQMMEITAIADIRTLARNVNERSMIGLCIAKLFNDPFALYESDGRIKIRNTAELGYVIIAPLITALTIWMGESTRNNAYDKVLFGARDGYILNKLYEILRESVPEWNLPKSLYLLMSRRMIISASTFTDDDLKHAYEYAPGFDIESNFHFKAPKASKNEKRKGYYEFWEKNKEAIFKGSVKNNENYKKYLKKKGVSSAGKYAFFDFVSLGSCQDFMERNGAFDFDAFYACFRFDLFEHRKALKHKDWLYMNVRESNQYGNYHDSNYFYQDYLFLERIMTSDKPSLSCFDDNGNPVFDEEQRSAEEIRFMKRIHKAVKDYFEEYIKLLWVEGIEISRVVPDMLYHYRQDEFSAIADSADCKMSAYDDLNQVKVEVKL
ncbi:Predicted hydrolase, HAD superfamily [Butyrivibrio sp. ob235]|uniref:hypothetical protein n=1 Tax=Butyrivibrio sp. ob235 TaxID=1761780 RepID=UPI0008C5FD0B|nr:hypothetical protein [Butyrivibrio sp. ob235]SEM26111.1 Predicted hydrolase, HAD superfamily [Butyrivibrio sp. ob235]